MLSKEENELLARTGPGTPMGELMRRYWAPALLSEELPEPDGDPLRFRLLGEDLVAFRDTQGRVGILEEACAHRCASLAYGRNEEGGLRCLYHGWKYDVTGKILETPAEPANSTFKDRIRQTAYLTREFADVIWVYMGPQDKVPTFPEWEWTAYGPDRRAVGKTIQSCNWAQALEGDIDSSHSDYLHSSELRNSRVRDHAPRLEIEDTEYGYRYAAVRQPGENPDSAKHVRITLFVAPFSTLTPPIRSVRIGEKHESATHRMYVPIDDETHAFFSFYLSRQGPIRDGEGAREAGTEPGYYPPGNKTNMHLQNRAAMRAGNWSGIQGIRAQDRAMTESMGIVSPRHKEHLGTSDVAVIRFRRRMIDAARAFMKGSEPIGIDPSIRYADLHSEERIVPMTNHWTSALDPLESTPAR